MSTVQITDESFERDVLQADGPVLVDFWAEWCGPCKQIAPALEQISDELGGQVTVAKLNIEESPTTPSRYGVRGIPTMMLFRGGQMTSMKVGAMPKQKILEWLTEAGVKSAAYVDPTRSPRREPEWAIHPRADVILGPVPRIHAHGRNLGTAAAAFGDGREWSAVLRGPGVRA